MSRPVLEKLERKYFITVEDLTPKVFMRITDNGVEMTVRFVSGTHGARDIKDALSRAILDEFDRAHIGIASGTYDIVGLPPLKIEPSIVREIASVTRQESSGTGSNVTQMRGRDDQRRAQ